ncbi:hypothetical protein B6U80_01745 [Candidatus Pacearchaeota archaeon ex4484_26]|nr:MAG: hypothetical protein B6U80_01745 [Candidatus Pacearchaeota archaeon ex4484_26]
MSRDLHAHPSFFHFILNRELDEFYISIALRFFALSMVGIFLPIYLFFKLNLPLPVVMYFFIIFAIFFALAAFMAAKIASQIGFKHLILMSIPFEITFFFLLILLPFFRIPLFLVSITGAVSRGFYWIGHHTDLAKFTLRKKRGEEVGLAFFVNTGAALLGPLAGGLILTFFNFTVLFLIGSLILLISTVPLFFSKDVHEKFSFSLKKVFKRASLKDAAAFTSQGIAIGSSGVLWPLFIFLILGGYFSLGLIGTLSGAISAFSAILVGKFSDKLGKRFFIRLGAFSFAGLWFFRTIVRTIFHVYLITLFAFIPGMASVPMDTLAYSKARFSKRIEEYLVFREIFLNLGRILAYLFMLVTASYIASFIFTGIAQVLLTLF